MSDEIQIDMAAPQGLPEMSPEALPDSGTSDVVATPAEDLRLLLIATLSTEIKLLSGGLGPTRGSGSFEQQSLLLNYISVASKLL
jgi:hypothetical protein